MLSILAAVPDLPPVRRLLTDPVPHPVAEVVLGYDDRILRRKRLVTSQGAGFMVDLPEVTSLDAVWGFELEDGRVIRIVAAAEPVLVITGPDLARYAWHIGNRHTPCQIESDRLVIRVDHVLEAMLRQLGARVQSAQAAFAPERGAYGFGRPMGHDHGHDNGHNNGHDHLHGHG